MRRRWPAVGLALLGLLLRLPHLGWGLPDLQEEALPMKKALEMWGWNTGHLRLDPETAGWPSLSFYLHLGVQHLYYGVGRLVGLFGDRYDFMVENAVDRAPLVLISRMVGVLCAAGVVYVGARLGQRLAGRAGLLLAGLLLALSPLLLRHAQLITPDILLTLLAALATAKIVDLGERGRRRDYLLAGLWIGLGVAAKYTPVLLALSLYLVHLRRLGVEGRSRRRAGLDDARLGWAALATVAAFVATSPYTLADLEVLRRDFGYQALHMSQGHFGQEEQGWGALYYLRDVLAPGLGTPALVLGLVGLGWAAVRRRGAWLSLALCALPFFLGVASLSTRFDRYMLPLLLPLAVGAAALPALLDALLATRPPRVRRAVLAATAAVVLLPAAAGALAYHRTKAVPDTLAVGRDWILEHWLDEDPAVAMEAYTPQVPSDHRELVRDEPFFARLSAAQRRRLLERPALRADPIPMNAVRTQLTAFYYDLRHYLPYDYLVTSSSVRGRYQARPERFERQVAFYADLERFATLVHEIAPAPGQEGPRLRFYAFVEAGKQALLAERGALEPGFYRPLLDRLHAPQFYNFIQAVGRRALQAERYGTAALYLDTLLETAGAGPMARSSVLALSERAAYAHLQAGDPAATLARCRAYLAEEPRSPRILGYRAQALERLGRRDEARAAYAECAAAAAGGDQAAWAVWAREQLERMEGGEPSGNGP